ncbi:MAG: response regulator transcription factor [Thermoleophilia bacterium]|nr:response regulator transcription factor [Thermoleophilia bacterium]
MIRVALADDQELVRTGFRMILESEVDITVVGEAADGAQALELVRHECPDVVLMDVRMPVLDGIAATARIVAAALPTRVLVLTTFDLDEVVFEALRSGAAGFLLKTGPADDLVRAVRVVAAGESLLSPSVTRRLVEEFARRPSGAPSASLNDLTPRELEVLQLLAQGLSNAEIAAELFVEASTVKSHVASILAKLGLRDRVQAVVPAYESGLVIAGSS